ncbi:MAG: hypothetical protein ACE5PM_09480 [Candidatus Hydrothermarchaeales archaeon]
MEDYNFDFVYSLVFSKYLDKIKSALAQKRISGATPKTERYIYEGAGLLESKISRYSFEKQLGGKGIW